MSNVFVNTEVGETEVDTLAENSPHAAASLSEAQTMNRRLEKAAVHVDPSLRLDAGLLRAGLLSKPALSGLKAPELIAEPALPAAAVPSADFDVEYVDAVPIEIPSDAVELPSRDAIADSSRRELGHSVVATEVLPPSVIASLEQAAARESAAVRAAWLIALSGDSFRRGEVIPLYFGQRLRYRLGVDATCTLILRSEGVSREHAEVHYDPEASKFFVTDLRSTNGTYLQSQSSGLKQIVGEEELVDGCLLRLGRQDVVFIFRCY